MRCTSVPERPGAASITATIGVMGLDPSAPRWSPDGFWWWDGVSWVPAAQAPMPPPPGAAPYYQPAPPFELKPSPGLRPFLIVFLAIDAVLFGLLTIFGALGVSQNYSTGQADAGQLALLAAFGVPFVLAVVALVGVVRRTAWARWVALAAGIGVSLTCLGSVIGIPIIVAATRAPIRRTAPTSP
jgi:hypothetical protein